MLQKNIKLYDLHLHSRFSSDSEADPAAEIEAAIKAGLSGMCFTEHNDFDYDNPESPNLFKLDFDNYTKNLFSIRDDFSLRSDAPEIYIGLEQGLTLPAGDRIESYDPEGKLDFIIGSSHVVDGLDPYYPQFWADKTIAEGVKRYFEYIYECVKTLNNFDVYGHLDYITRYIPDKSLKDNHDHLIPMDLIREILSVLIHKGKGIEINTAGWRKSYHANPSAPIIKLYKEIGGEIITTGSDAHSAADIGHGIVRAINVLKECGFKYVTFFSKRKPVFVSI